jgi:hypothetical protein
MFLPDNVKISMNKMVFKNEGEYADMLKSATVAHDDRRGTRNTQQTLKMVVDEWVTKCRKLVRGEGQGLACGVWRVACGVWRVACVCSCVRVCVCGFVYVRVRVRVRVWFCLCASCLSPLTMFARVRLLLCVCVHVDVCVCVCLYANSFECVC